MAPQLRDSCYGGNAGRALAMPFSEEDRTTILKLLGALGRGELSTLAASLSLADSQIGTSRDSSNYALLHELVELGYAKEHPFEEELFADALVTSFTINEDVKGELGQLLESLPASGDG